MVWGRVKGGSARVYGVMSLGREEVEEALADVSQHVKSARQLHASSSQSTSSSSQYPLDGLHTVRLIDPISRAYTLVSSDVEETIRSKIQREKKQVEEKEIMSRRLAETPEYVREQANSLRLLMASSQDAGVIDSQKKLLELREQVWSNKSKKKQEDDVGDEQLELVLVGGGEWESRVCNEKIFYVNKVTKETTWFHPFTLSQPLPPGWEKVQDGGGRIMYRRGTEVTYVHPNLSPAYLDALSQQSSLWKRLTPLLGSKSDTRLNDSARAHDAVMQFVTPEHRELAVRQATFLAGPAWSKARGESSSLVASGALLRSFLKSLQSPVKMASAGWVLVHNTSLEDLTSDGPGLDRRRRSLSNPQVQTDKDLRLLMSMQPFESSLCIRETAVSETIKSTSEHSIHADRGESSENGSFPASR
eukprot:758619-Hanusia_phi.AAC.1